MTTSPHRKPRKSARSTRQLSRKSEAGSFTELAAALAQRSDDTGAGASAPRAFVFPDLVETDEWGFDTTTGDAAFDVGGDSLVHRFPISNQIMRQGRACMTKCERRDRD